jgi:putative FmdB family regulatory protein
MPTYEYKCVECGNVFENFHGINDDSPVNCPECEVPALKLLSGGAGIIVKGRAAAVKPLQCGNEKPCCGRDSRCNDSHCDM